MYSAGSSRQANARSRVTQAVVKEAKTTAAKRAIKFVSDARIQAEKTMQQAQQKVDSAYKSTCHRKHWQCESGSHYCRF